MLLLCRTTVLVADLISPSTKFRQCTRFDGRSVEIFQTCDKPEILRSSIETRALVRFGT